MLPFSSASAFGDCVLIGDGSRLVLMVRFFLLSSRALDDGQVPFFFVGLFPLLTLMNVTNDFLEDWLGWTGLDWAGWLAGWLVGW